MSICSNETYFHLFYASIRFSKLIEISFVLAECSDIYEKESCEVFRARRFCKMFRRYCQLTCGVCQPPTTTTPEPTTAGRIDRLNDPLSTSTDQLVMRRCIYRSPFGEARDRFSMTQPRVIPKTRIISSAASQPVAGTFWDGVERASLVWTASRLLLF